MSMRGNKIVWAYPPEVFDARAEALESCVTHLGLNWTDDSLERQEGDRLAAKLQKKANSLRDEAARRRKIERVEL